MTTKTCPACGADMILRTAGRGRYKGQQFWGCGRFPDCREIQPVTVSSPGATDSPSYQITAVHDRFTSRSESEMITISRISTAACPFAYYKEYVEKPKQTKAFESMEAAIGLYVHDAAEHLFEQFVDSALTADVQLPVSELVDRFADAYIQNEQPLAPYRIIRPDHTTDDYLILLTALLSNFNRFLRSTLAGHTPVRAEGALELLTGSVVIRGKYDLITTDPAGQLILWDWKTGRAPNKAFAGSTEQLEMQLGVYGTWMRHKYADAAVQGTAVFLQDHTVDVSWSYSEEREQSMLHYLCTWRQRLNDWSEYPPAASQLCNWCGWNTVCPGYSIPL